MEGRGGKTQRERERERRQRHKAGISTRGRDAEMKRAGCRSGTQAGRRDMRVSKSQGGQKSYKTGWGQSKKQTLAGWSQSKKIRSKRPPDPKIPKNKTQKALVTKPKAKTPLAKRQGSKKPPRACCAVIFIHPGPSQSLPADRRPLVQSNLPPQSMAGDLSPSVWRNLPGE